MKRWVGVGLLVMWVVCSEMRAGDSAGNGGDLVRCEGVETSQVLLDYFEAKQKNPIYEVAFAEEAISVEERIDRFLRRLSSFDPPRADYYRTKWARFEEDRSFVKGPLEDVPDTGDLNIPANCKVQQLALQRPPAFPTDRRYLIDEAMWAELENAPAQRAGLILHEIIYSEALKLGHENSQRTRRFNAVISGADFETMSQKSYNELAAQTFQTVYPVVFLQSEMELSALAGKKFFLHLEPLLKKPVPPDVQWFFDANRPTWLNFSADGLAIEGTPGPEHAGISSFLLIAKTPFSNALARVRMLIDK